jgi:hypothetical protein
MRTGQPLDTTRLGALEVTRFAIGGNPFSGFSHQGDDRDREMLAYFTAERIKETLRLAEQAGVTTLFARADRHVVRTLFEYWNDGGTIQWIAQTATDTPDPMMNIPFAARWGAKAIYLHGGQTEYFLANDQGQKIIDAIKKIRDLGLPAGVAGHCADHHDWVRDHVDCDFQMCCYYNSSDRSKDPAHHATYDECFVEADRDRMVQTIARLGRRPCVHYKILAAGRTPPEDAFRFAGQHLRPHDVVCVGIFLKDNPRMIDEDLALFKRYCAAKQPATARLT